MYDSVVFCQARFLIRAQKLPLVAGAVSRAPYFGVHLDP
jgi:hypothetical protein